MARANGARRATTVLADATGRTDEELARRLTVVVVVAVAEEALLGSLRVLNRLDDLGFAVLGHAGRRA